MLPRAIERLYNNPITPSDVTIETVGHARP